MLRSGFENCEVSVCERKNELDRPMNEPVRCVQQTKRLLQRERDTPKEAERASRTQSEIKI